MTTNINVTPDNFQDELDKHEGKQVIVDFWATWCGPCRIVGPILEEIDETHDDIVVLKVDVDENQEISQALRIQSIPTMMFFKDGKVNAPALIGAVPRTKILANITENSL